MEGKIRVTLVATGLGQAEELTMPRTGMLQQPQPVEQSQPVPKPVGYGTQQSVQPNQNYGHQSQPIGFNHAPQNAGTTQQPRTIDPNQVFSPSSIPGFMRNGR